MGLFYHSWTLPFHLFTGELAEVSGNNPSHHCFQLQEEKIGAESEMPKRAFVTSSNEDTFHLEFSDFFLTILAKTSPTSRKLHSILMPTITIMNRDAAHHQ